MATIRSLPGRRRDAAFLHALEAQMMRQMLSFGIALVLTTVAISAWATMAPRSKTQVEISGVGINPFMLMKNSTGLEVQQYDLF
jgi:heme/copper-type cytochrome/quinol oxidase subunit 4